VIVVDDCSRIEEQRLLYDIISEFKNLNIQMFRHNEHLGTSNAKNSGILKTKTPYIWFLDSDTEMINPDALEVGCQILDKNPDIGVVAAEIVEDSNRQRYVREAYLLRSLWSAFIHHPLGDDIRKEVAFVATCNFLTRTDLIKEIGGFHSKLENGEDKLACLQIRALGYKIFLDSRFGVLHYRSLIDKSQFWMRTRITFRDCAFIYGATNGFWKLATFHIDCMLSLWKLYKNNMEMFQLFIQHQEALDVSQNSHWVMRLGEIVRLMVQYVLANKTYMAVKGYCFRLTSKMNSQTIQDRARQHSKRLTHEL
jgi:GT2 family glycosyltransferase